MRLSMPIIGASLLFAVGGCFPPSAPTTVQQRQGLIWVFPGVEGGRWQVAPACHAWRSVGVQSAIQIHDWDRPFALLLNLVQHERNRRAAQMIAGRIAEYRARYPDTPIDLVGYSGGGGMAIMVAEALPAQVRLRHIILAQPALSPGYDLTKALKHVDGNLVHFYNPHDWLILGAGTRLFGTMDRKQVFSSGKVGFDLERAVSDETLRTKVEQVGWTREMLYQGHLGGHTGMFAYRWNQKQVGPYLLPETIGPR